METATQKLHRLTSYTWGWYQPPREDDDLIWSVPVDDPRVVRAPDVDRFPWFFKRYAMELPRVPLPRDLPATTAPAVAVLAGTADVSRSAIDLPQLSRLLHLSAGSCGRRGHTRHGSSAPPDPRAAVSRSRSTSRCRTVWDLPAGLHWYDPLDHALVQVGPQPRGDAPALVVTGVPWRTGWRYRERGYRHVYWDAGTMLSQLLAAADSAGLAPRLHTRFPDAAVAGLVGADGVHEWPVAVVALGDGAPALDATGSAAAGEVDAAPLEFPLVTAAQRAGERDTLGTAWERGAVEASARGPIRSRRWCSSAESQRRMDPDRGLPESLLRTSMLAAMRGVELPHFVAVHDVDGVSPGIYRWPDLSSPVRAGAMRDELYVASMDQELARDAAFVVIAATDVGALDDREYREAQLAAGLVEGRLHLLAYGLGASASG